MKITLEPTNIMTTINGVPVRVWQGVTDNGIPIHAHIALVGIQDGLDCSELDILTEVKTPRADVAMLSVPLRLVID